MLRRAMSIAATTVPAVRYYDVGVNLCDEMFKGIYRSKTRHEPDLEAVLRRAKSCHVDRMLLTGSSLKESSWTLGQAKMHSGQPGMPLLYCTVGVHPCSVMEFENSPEEHLSQLRALIQDNLGAIHAFGEIGLDYDRLHYTPEAQQKKYFELQLKLACEFDLPLFLHMRAACKDFLDVLLPFVEGTRGDGLELKNKNLLVHSFSGTSAELALLLEHPTFRISVNGCSLKTEENCAVAAQIPLDRLLIETDAPWCEIKKSSAAYRYLTQAPNAFYPEDRTAPKISKNEPGKLHDLLPWPVAKPEKRDEVTGHSEILVKSRNEPCLVGYTAQAMAALKKVPPETLIDACWQNSVDLFG